MLLLAAALHACGAAAQPGGEELVRRINDYREAPQRCEGRQREAVGPLTAAPLLSQVDADSAAQLQAALKQRGYLASQLQVVRLSGPADAASVMAMLEERHCRLLSSPAFSEVGVARSGRSWRVVFAQPLLAAEIGEWEQAGRRVLELVNAARAKPRRCGGESFAAAKPLAWNARLGAAALAHSRDMAQKSYLGHRGSDGSQVGVRAERQGYRWGRIGENVASGQGDAEKAVSGWLASPPHCRNIMEPGFTEMGAAYAVNPRSDQSIYWTQVFGAPL
ncbi:CAP domain-containing protein [Caldimonas tepidiphila]|uniref:CAP domain-containing protein n=1 Tax=Caldimonas tepidiphila TaxID=2315841 RepID=UPI00196A4340|nr:CAP domain-containing protein [Caldimonas tepidiphila]